MTTWIGRSPVLATSMVVGLRPLLSSSSPGAVTISPGFIDGFLVISPPQRSWGGAPKGRRGHGLRRRTHDPSVASVAWLQATRRRYLPSFAGEEGLGSTDRIMAGDELGAVGEGRL